MFVSIKRFGTGITNYKPYKQEGFKCDPKSGNELGFLSLARELQPFGSSFKADLALLIGMNYNGPAAADAWAAFTASFAHNMLPILVMLCK